MSAQARDAVHQTRLARLRATAPPVCLGSSPPLEGGELLVPINPKAWSPGPDCIRDVAGREMAIVVLDHARVHVTKVLSHDHERHPTHDRMARPGMPEHMERSWWTD